MEDNSPFAACEPLPNSRSPVHLQSFKEGHKNMSKRLPSGKVKSLEDRLDHFAFMRRAREKVQLEETAKQKAFKNEEEWTSSMEVSGCTVIMEGGADTSIATGRMSFLNFNPVIEKVQKDLESSSRTLQRIRDCGAEYRREMGSGAEISDLEMAKRLSKIDGFQSSLPEFNGAQQTSGAASNERQPYTEQRAKRTRIEEPHDGTSPANHNPNLIEVKMSKRCLAHRFQTSSMNSDGHELDKNPAVDEGVHATLQGRESSGGNPVMLGTKKAKKAKKKKQKYVPLPQQQQTQNGVQKKKKKTNKPGPLPQQQQTQNGVQIRKKKKKKNKPSNANKNNT